MELETARVALYCDVSLGSFIFLPPQPNIKMTTAGVQRPPQPAAESYGDYIPDDFADFGGLFTDDEQSGPGSKSTSAKAQQTKGDGTAGLGIDEEVSVKKRARDPRVKLDEFRCVQGSTPRPLVLSSYPHPLDKLMLTGLMQTAFC